MSFTHSVICSSDEVNEEIKGINQCNYFYRKYCGRTQVDQRLRTAIMIE